MKITDITPKTISNARKIRLAAYCRVSSDSTEQLHSFATQIRYYSDYVKKHPEYELVDIYADEGVTGTSMSKRNEINRLFRDCKLGKIDRIITKSVSRFARNTEELLEAVRMLKDIGVSIYFEEQGIDTTKLNMEMIITFPGMAAQQESDAISGNIRWSIQKRMQSGEYNCTYPAYGFKSVNAKLTINAEEATIVKRIFDLYLQGFGTQLIASMLNKDNVPRRKGQTKWYRHTVVYILTNERYMGDALLQKKYYTETLPHKLLTNKGEKPKYYVENSNDPIVSRETFQAVQELMKKKRIGTYSRTIYPLSGKIKCPECGYSFRRQVIENKTYWICNGRAKGQSKCTNRRVREDMVYDAFTRLSNKLYQHRVALIETTIKQLERLRVQTSQSQERIQEIDRTIADLSAKNHVITKLHTSGVISVSEYNEQSSSINNKITELRIERKKKLSEDADDEIIESLKSLNEIFIDYIPIATFDEQLFEDIVEKITVHSNSKITFKLIGDIELTEFITEKGRCHSV